MFVRHQKATAHWQCSIWPNMEGKNAAFSRNQTGKKEKKKRGRFSCMLCTQQDRALTLTTQWPQSWLPLKTAWLMVMVDLSWHLSEHHWTSIHVHIQCTHTYTTHEPWERGTSIFALRWHFIFKHTKAFFTFAYELCARVSAACSVSEPPGREHSSWWKSSRLKHHSPLLKLETVCLSSPPRYMERLWHSPARAALQKKTFLCGYVISQETYWIISDTFWNARVCVCVCVCVSCQQWTRAARRRKKTGVKQNIAQKR